MNSQQLTDISVRKLKAPATGQTEVWDGRIPGFGVRVTPKGTKSFILLYRSGGRQKRLTIGRYPALTLSDARKKAQEALRDAALGGDPAGDKRDRSLLPDQYRIEVFVSEFIEKYAKRKNRSWKETERVLKVEFVQKWGRGDVRRISKNDVLAVIDGIVERGSPSTANHAFRAVRKLFNWGVERGILDSSPCQGLTEPSKSVKRDRVLDREELSAVWKAADEMGYPYGHIIKLLTLTGQRREEVAGMRWDELDLTNNTWTIARGRNKSDREHKVSLSPRAVGVIKSIPQTNDTLVFSARGTDKQVSGFSKWKMKIDELSNTNGWTVHDLRRTVATELAGLNVQPHVIERVLNHSNGILGGVAGIYNRFGYQDEMREALNLWADRIDQIKK